MRMPTVACLIALSTLPAGAPPRAQTRAAMTPDDLFRTERVGAIAWSPTGAHAAVEITRPGDELDALQLRTDVYVLEAATGTLRRLTRGATETGGFWDPVWSPDGRTLAMLTSTGDGVVNPALWRLDDATPHSVPAIDVRLGIGGEPLHWLDARTLLATAWPADAERSGNLYFRAMRGSRAAGLWARRREGVSASVTVLEAAGGTETTPRFEPTTLIRYDIVSGAPETVLSAQLHLPTVSPDGSKVAYFAPGPGLPTETVASLLEHSELYSPANWGSALVIADLVSGTLLAGPLNLLDPDYDSPTWSLDSTRLAALGSARDDASGARLVRFDGARLAHDPGSPLRDATALHWHADGLLGRVPEGDGRSDWWIDSGVNLTATLPSAPGSVDNAADGSLLVPAGNRLWRVRVDTRETTPVSDERTDLGRLRSLGHAGVYLAGAASPPSVVRVDGDRVVVESIAGPEAPARIRSVAPDGLTAVFSATTANDSRLWAGPAGAVLTDELWAGNSWVTQRQTATARHLEYVSLNGEPLDAWLLMPAAPATGPLPMIVNVYPSTVYDAQEPSNFALATGDFLHPQLFAALGYAVLLPSMPEGAEPLQDHPIDELTDGVLPALDAAIATGLIDATRVAVIGQSAGGYATLGLIGQTNRFRAAVASASYSDMESLYGTFYGQHRSGEGGHPQLGQVLRIMQMERGFLRLGGPPWEHAERYRHNSPLTHVEAVDTPLMLVHGDLDFIPIQQAEQMFTSLFRLGKPVRFVRYHGEWHTVSGRANVLDLWRRLEDWLALYLQP